MEMGAETAVMKDLIASLERATLMAKQLPNTIQPSNFHEIYTTLNSTHHHLTNFLSHYPNPFPPSNTFVGDKNDTDEPMQVVDDENETNMNCKNSIDGVEERMRECFIQNKRPKRPLSPSSAALEDRRSYENKAGSGGSTVAEFDPRGTKLRALDLVYQFHA